MKTKMWVRSENKIICRLCPHFCCLTEENPVGRCKVRYVRQGELFSLVDDNLAAVHVDPVEKKPLYHFFPKTEVLSLGTAGCNFACPWCQNYSLSAGVQWDGISLEDCEKLKNSLGRKYRPEDLVHFAETNNIPNIAYTYNEPTVFFEQLSAIAVLAFEKNIKNILVSNGYFSKFVFSELKSFIHAMNIDIKAFSEQTYQNFCRGSLRPVLENCVKTKDSGIHLEVTTLFIPGLNDSEREIRELVRFVAENLGLDTVWHISAFYPQHKMQDRPKTPLAVLDKACQIGKESGLRYVYYGNVPKNNSTYCPGCGTELIRRQGYSVEILEGFSGICPKCGSRTAGIW